MNLIEFLGTPGSGKSTLVSLLAPEAAAAGIELHRLDTVGRVAMADGARDPVTRAVARSVGRFSHSAWKRAMARSGDRVAVLCRAVVARPELVTAVIEANDEHNRDAGPDLVMGMLLNHLIAFQLAEETLGGDDWLLLDEGLCNRVTSLFAAGTGELDRDGLDRYLDAVPAPDVLVVVRTPVDICYRRLDEAGWTERMAAKPPQRRRAFLERAAELVELTWKRMEAAGTTVIPVDGTVDAAASVPGVLAAVRGATATR